MEQFFLLLKYSKIPKISPGAYIFQRPFLRGLFLEGLMYEGKFAFQNRLSQLVVGRKFTIFALFLLCIRGQILRTSPLGCAYFRRGDLTEGFCVTIWEGLYLEGLIFGILRYIINTLSQSVHNKEVKFVRICSQGPRYCVRCPYQRGSVLQRYFLEEMYENFVGRQETVCNREVSILERCPHREVRL